MRAAISSKVITFVSDETGAFNGIIYTISITRDFIEGKERLRSVSFYLEM